jgi:hypothetical protein
VISNGVRYRVHRTYYFNGPPPQSVLDDRDRRLAVEQDPCAALLGDPHPSRSALAQWHERQRQLEARPSISAVPTARERLSQAGIAHNLVHKVAVLSEENAGGATAQLQQRNRRIIELHNRGGMTARQIGHAVGCSRCTCIGVINRARHDAALRELWPEREVVGAQKCPDDSRHDRQDVGEICATSPQPRSPQSEHLGLQAEHDRPLTPMARKAYRLLAEGWSWIEVAFELAVPASQLKRESRESDPRRRNPSLDRPQKGTRRREGGPPIAPRGQTLTSGLPTGLAHPCG